MTETPLDRLFADEDRPDEVDVDAATTIDADRFVEQMETIADAADRIDTIGRDAERLREVGLRESDVRALIYGRNAGVRKGDIDAVLDALDDVASGRGDLLTRMVADVSGLTLSDTEEILDELGRLNDRYGGEDGD